MNTIEAKRIRIVDYLRLLGHEPVKVRGGQYWYLSPLRKEDTPSFKVNDRLNEWYDFGLSEGGSIIELAMLFLRTSSVSEVLRLIEVQTGAAPLLRTRPHNAMPDAIEEMMKGVEVVPLNHHALLSYIHSRGIDTQTARQFCREIHYELHRRHYFAIAFGNVSGGYEMRNPYYRAERHFRRRTGSRHEAEARERVRGLHGFPLLPDPAQTGRCRGMYPGAVRPYRNEHGK